MPSDPTPEHGTRLPTRLRRYFFGGLVALFPVIVTLYLLLLTFKFVDGILGQFINAYLLRRYNFEIPGLGLMMTVIIIFTAGILSSHFLGQWLFRRLEGWFASLPLIRRIYPSVKQLSDFLFTKEHRESAFRRVVLVPYPRQGIYSVAFVTNEQVTMVTGRECTLLTLLLPNPPSPFTGPIIYAPKEDVIPVSMTVEDTIKFIVSGGVVAPPLVRQG